MGASSISSYLKDVSKTKLLTREQEVSLSQRIESGDRSARDEMINSNLRLAISIAKKYSRRGCSFEDLIQESNIGLMKAVDRFDWRRGFKFSTYASWWIKQSVSRHVSMHRSTIRIPAHTSGLIYKIKRITAEYEDEFSQEPSVQEIAELLGVTESMIETSMRSAVMQHLLSLDATIGDESGGRSFSEIIKDEAWVDPGFRLDTKQMIDRISMCMSSLSAREEKILRLRFGIFEDIVGKEQFNISNTKTAGDNKNGNA